MQFKEHTLSEEGDKFCNMCEFTTQNSHDLANHYRETHDVALSSDGGEGESCGDEESGLDQPKVTSSGKVKQFRCKQCSHTAVTKREFWEHTRGHIKAERLLTCPKCPFVTEYKHHFEYHLRNHFGSKPFKCDQCSYSCVNKSMLNSHLKSHSNVYQFRCSDCAYATKYCHSLKLHLRKYGHKPAMVLNPDGSPNPLPIVDVYGTRRGPKSRPKRSDENLKSASPVPVTTAMSPLYAVPQIGILPPPQFPYPFQFPPFTTSPPLETDLAAEEFVKLKQLYQLNNNTDYRSEEETATYLTTAPLDLSKSEVSSQERAGKNRRKGVAVKRVFAALQDSFQDPIREPKLKAVSPHAQMLSSPEQFSPNKSESDSKSRADPSSLSNTDESLSIDSVDVSGTGLNQSPEQVFRKSAEQLPEAMTRVQPYSELLVPRAPDQFRKLPDQVSVVDGHRTPESIPKEGSERVDVIVKTEENNNEEIVRGGSKPTTPDTSCTNSGDENENNFRCSFCDIIFKNLAMYSIHMGFHDYRDPFTCNMCGHKTKDEMAFFLHIARFPHS